MNRFFRILGVLFLVSIISQQVLAENAIFDAESKILTIPNVQISTDNNAALYSIKIKVETDGALSLIDMKSTSSQENELNDNESLLYAGRTNPLLYSYIALESRHSNINDIQTIRDSAKWSKENVPGVYNCYGDEFTFYEDGTGVITCDNPMEPVLCQQNPVPSVWTIDNYGNLVFGTTIDNTLFRFIWVLLKENEKKFTVYFQDTSLLDDSSAYSNGFKILEIKKE